MSVARRIVTLTGKALLGIVIVIISAYGLLLLVNLNDAEPSTLTYELRQSYESRPAPEDSENAFLVVLGFSALPEDDPLTMGIARRKIHETLLYWRVAIFRVDDSRLPRLGH